MTSSKSCDRADSVSPLQNEGWGGLILKDFQFLNRETQGQAQREVVINLHPGAGRFWGARTTFHLL